VAGVESNTVLNQHFTQSGYDIQSNVYFTPLSASSKYQVRIGAGFGYAHHQEFIAKNRLRRAMAYQSGPLINAIVEKTSTVNNNLRIGVKYNRRIFDWDSEEP
jgi:hypothetical protein